MKSKSIFFILFSFVFLLTGCSSGSKNVFQWEKHKDYVVGLKINSFETKGILIVEEETVSFLHGDPQSPLYGMTERFGENGYESLLYGIEWKSTEVKMQGEIIRNAVQMAEIKEGWAEKDDTLNGRGGRRRTLRSGSDWIEIFLEKETGNILHLTAEIDGDRIELAFSNKNETISFPSA